MKGKITRSRILDSAVSCIARFGPTKTNARLIAGELGISPASVFYHFPKQDQIFKALIPHIVGTNQLLVEKELAKQKTYEARLWAHMGGNLAWGQRHPDQVAALLFGMIEGSHDKEISNLVKEIFDMGEERIFSLLSSGLAEEEFKLVGAVRPTARLFHKSLMGLIVANFYERNTAKRSTLPGLKESLEAHFLRS